MTWRLVAAFDVVGDPKGQPRSRAVNRFGQTRVYDPGTADAWKAEISLAAADSLRAMSGPIKGPVKLAVAFFFFRPKRMETKKLANMTIPHVAKPDIDNACKAVMDALTESGMWRDDAQVAELEARKWYAMPGRPSGALIQVFEETKQ